MSKNQTTPIGTGVIKLFGLILLLVAATVISDFVTKKGQERRAAEEARVERQLQKEAYEKKVRENLTIFETNLRPLVGQSIIRSGTVKDIKELRLEAIVDDGKNPLAVEIAYSRTLPEHSDGWKHAYHVGESFEVPDLEFKVTVKKIEQIDAARFLIEPIIIGPPIPWTEPTEL